ncbi:DUF4232 domain-containing protein [Cnuibacter sp. UC19_7]|uniref:DUF4232 domain-containing protein n=1 Tax=Cnuibacter sp. UC19_7 TaxID=3350166 RepID=UPI003672E66B
MFSIKAHPVRNSIIGAAGAAMLVAAVGIGAGVANAGTLPACEASQLTVSIVDQQAGMSHREVTYEVTNTSDQACLVHGAPTEVTQTDGAATTTATGSNYFGQNGPEQMIRLDPGQSATGEIAWTIPQTTPGTTPYTLSVDLPDVGLLETGYHDSTGALDGAYTVTNLQPAQ